MVSYTRTTFLLRLHSKDFREANFAGVFIQLVFGACNPFTGLLQAGPTTNVLLKIGAPRTASDGLSSVLIGDFPVLEPFGPMGGGAR
jgi:hypothetical protein